MFGGICFMVEGNMCCGVSRDSLMRGFVFVEAEALEDEQEFQGWIAEALDFVRTLPPK